MDDRKSKPVHFIKDKEWTSGHLSVGRRKGISTALTRTNYQTRELQNWTTKV